MSNYARKNSAQEGEGWTDLRTADGHPVAVGLAGWFVFDRARGTDPAPTEGEQECTRDAAERPSTDRR